MGRNGNRLTLPKADLDHFRDRLIERAQQLRDDLQRVGDRELQPTADQSGELSHLPMHLADQATETFEQEKAIDLAEQQSQELRQVEDALERLTRGQYGICENCEKPIGRERLEALPSARLCFQCQSRAEAS
jgi:RNA polymerase-binding protein DksA